MNDNPGGAPEPTEKPAPTGPEPTEKPAPTTTPEPAKQPSIEELAASMRAEREAAAQGERKIVEFAPAESAQAPEDLAPENSPVPEEIIPKKKHKVGAIVAVVIILLATVAAVVALLVLKPFQTESKMDAAMSDLVENGAPKMLSLTGTVTVEPKVESEVAKLVVDFDSGLNNRNGENFTKATVIAIFEDEREFKFNAEEIHTKDGDLYLRLSRVADQIVEYSEPDLLESPLMESIGVFEAIDNEWVMIPGSDFSNTTDIYGLDSPVVCFVNAAGKLGEFTDSFTADYNANPFLVYSEGNIPIAQKNDTLYRIGFDNAKLTSFINDMDNKGFINSLLACTEETAISDDSTVAEIEELVSHFPEIYVEVNDNNKFTRLYLDLDLEEASVVADVAIGYPTSVTIDEPELYITLSNVLERLLTEFYGGIPLEFEVVTE